MDGHRKWARDRLAARFALLTPPVRLGIGLLALFASNAAGAQCVVCDEVVTMNEQLKKCFVQGYETFAASLTQSGKPYGDIDLSPCAGAPAMPQKERALGGLRDLPVSSDVSRIKMRYRLDGDSLKCLRSLVEARAGSFDPRVHFDLLKECKK